MSVDLKNFQKSLSSLLDEKVNFFASDIKDTPLFTIMQYKANIVAFAELNGNAVRMRETSFNFFRQQFIEKQREWNNYDLSLVYCLTSDKVEDSLINEIQLDPYFCKKYVIDITNENQLVDQFRNLPFVPLLSDAVKLVKRPLTAKELLKQHDVDIGLIDSIIIRRVKSPQTILKDCLKVKEIPKWQYRNIRNNISTDEFLELIPKKKLSKITINNFRAYRSEHFDLNADVVVLYGNNGLGKTSFIEAIDFACTGSVLRLDERKISKNLNRFNEALKNLNSEDINDTFVKFELSEQSKIEVLERNLNDRTKSIFKSSDLDRKQVIDLISKPKDEFLNMGTEELVNLFRASHIFGQDFQSLTLPAFLNDSEWETDIISRMLSFQDYTEGINKGREVIGLLSRELKKKKNNISNLDSKISDMNFEIKTYEKKFDKIKDKDVLSKKVQEVITHLKDKAKIKLPKKITSNNIRKIRAELQAKVNTKDEYISELYKIFEKFDVFKNETLYNEKTKKEIEKIVDHEKKENDNRINIETKISKVENNIKELIKSQRGNESLIENIQWLLANYKEYQNTVHNIKNKEKEIKFLSNNLNNHHKELERINNQNEKSIIQFEKNRIDLEQIEKKLLEYNELKSKLNEYKADKKKIRQIVNSKKQLVDKFAELKKENTNNNRKINKVTSNLETTNEKIKNIQKNQTELKSLLENIQRYILSNECPVCGHEHKSKKELIERLQSRIGRKNESIDQLLKIRADLTKENENLNSIRRKYELEMKEINTQLESIENDKIELRNKTQQIKKLAKNLKIQLDDDKVLVKINKKIETLQNETKTNEEELKDLSKLINNFDKTFREIKIKVIECENGMHTKNALVQKYQNEKKKLEEYVSGFTITFSNKQKEIKGIKNKVSDENKRLIEEHINAEKLLSNLNKKLKISKDKTIGINKTLKTMEKTLTDSEAVIDQFNILSKKLKLYKDISKSDIERLIDQSELESDNLNDSIKIINELEITLEALQTSALVTKLKIDVRKLINDRKKSQEIYNKMNKWLLYFNKLVDELKKTRNKSIKDYIKNLGPLSSKIQQRLRAVYNFGEIKLESHEGKVQVKTHHLDKELLPTDYYSESQIQILVLSLFLSVALTQNWSSFNTVLLDDPVTHFDDMNCYAFTDLIRGIVNTSNNKYQFIISTCEERLYALMKQKFNKMNGKAIFYELKTIGKNGPVIDKFELNPDYNKLTNIKI